MGKHHQLQVLRRLPAAVVGCTARGTLLHVTQVVFLGMGVDACKQMLIELAIMSLMRADEIGSGSPQLTERHISCVGGASEEALAASAEEQRLRILDHTLGGHDVFPLLFARHIIQKGSCHLSEVATAHAHATHILADVELLVVETAGIAECRNGLLSVIGAQRVVALHAESISHNCAVGGIRPCGHRRAGSLEHHRPVVAGIGHALRITFAVADAQEEIGFVASLIDEVGNTISALADAQVVIVESPTSEQIRQKHVVDVADMSQMAVPIEGIGVTSLHVYSDRISRQTMTPEDGLLHGFEVGFVPHVHAKGPPLWVPRMQVGLIYRKAFRIGLGNELRLTRNWEHMVGVDGLAQTHVVVAAHRVVIWLEVDVLGDVEIHAAAHVLNDESIAPGAIAFEVDVPHIGTYQVLTTRLLRRVSLSLPQLHDAGLLLAARLHIVEIHLATLPSLIVALSAIAQPLVEVGRLH